MSVLFRVLGGLAALLIVSGPVAADPASSKAAEILAAARAATGGAALDAMTGWHETGEHDGVRYETWLNPHRYGMTVRETRDGKIRTHGFDGVVDWRVGDDGVLHVSRDPAAIADSRQSAYFSIYGFFFPDRFAGDAVFIGQRGDSGEIYDVLNITPEGAKPLEVWFDHKTHLMMRGVDRGGPKPLTMTASDYRRVGGMMVAFHIAVSDGDPKHAQQGQVSTVDIAPVDDSVFAPPKKGADALK